MPLRCLFQFLWSLISPFLRSTTKSRCGIDGSDAVDPFLSSAVERYASDSSSHDSFELPSISRVSDVAGMETDYYSVSSPLLLKVADASTQFRTATDQNQSWFDQEKQPQPTPPKRSDSDSDSDSEFGFAAIQQLLKKVHVKSMERKLCLPTILEDCESYKVGFDMKPFKLQNKKFDHKDSLQQIQTFHRIYTEKMHKLDVLNQQTLSALSFIGLKGEAQEHSMHKKRKKISFLTVGGAMRSAFGVKFLCAKVSCDEDEIQKSSSAALMSKLELIYTGQLCLSWEILNWQYIQAIKLQKLDLQASFLYNQVADEFLHFQLALRRFVEDNANQGCARMRNYIEKRFASCQFLQIPIIKDDSLKEGKKLKKGECFVTISCLVKIIGECRKVFYELLREKKHGATETMIVPWDQTSQALFVQAQTKLHKKKKRVREVAKSKGGLVKMICHTKEQPGLDQEVFDASVALKLVAKVLTMSEISRDQILWCHTKLDEIKLVDRRLYIDTTFLLFPC